MLQQNLILNNDKLSKLADTCSYINHHRYQEV